MSFFRLGQRTQNLVQPHSRKLVVYKPQIRGGARFKGKLKLRASDRHSPLISIVTAVYNGAVDLRITIQSLSTQTYDNFEYLVIDGGSSDGSVEVLEEAGDLIDFWISEPDSGIYDAWNKGLANVRGDWIGFLGSGDRYTPDALSEYAHNITLGQRDLEYISSRVIYGSDESSRRIGSAWKWPDFAHHMTVAHVGSLHSRSLFRRYGEYDPRYRIVGDYELLLRAGSKLRAAFVDNVTAFMLPGGISNSIAALREARLAKVATLARSPRVAAVDYAVAVCKHAIRNAIA